MKEKRGRVAPFWAVGGVATLKDFESVIANILKAALPLAGLAAGLMVLVAGFKILTAGGNKEGMQKAQATLTYAFYGLILLFLSWFILKFIEFFTGMPVTEFVIGR